MRQINVKQILPNEDNFYDTSNVDDLKDSIELLGIKQPLLVKNLGNNQYKVIAGHRRLIAARQLFESGKTEFEHVPCIVEPDAGSIKEKILLIHTNSTTRELSDWEKVEQLAQLKELFSELKKTHKVPGKIRDLLADTLQVSPTTVGRMETVDKNLVPEFKDELKAKNISMNTAVELSKLDEEKQKEALQQHKARGSKTKAKEVQEPTKHIDPVQSDPEMADDEPSLFDDFEFKFLYRKALNKTVSNVDNRVQLCAANYREQPNKHNQNELRAYELVKQLLEDELTKLEG